MQIITQNQRESKTRLIVWQRGVIGFTSPILSDSRHSEIVKHGSNSPHISSYEINERTGEIKIW